MARTWGQDISAGLRQALAPAPHRRDGDGVPARAAETGEAAAVEPAGDIGGIVDAGFDELVDQRPRRLQEDLEQRALQSTRCPLGMTGMGQWMPVPKEGSTGAGESSTALACPPS